MPRATPARLVGTRLRTPDFDSVVEIYLFRSVYVKSDDAISYLYEKDRKQLYMDRDYRESGVFSDESQNPFRVLGQKYAHIQVLQDLSLIHI